MSLYPVPADAQGSVQHVTLKMVPVDVLAKLLSWFSQVKQLECDEIHLTIQPPQEVQCGLRCTGLVYQSLFDSVLIMDAITDSKLPRNDLTVLGHV